MTGGLRVALDVTPLAGDPTGISHSVRGLLDAFASGSGDVGVSPFAISTRARRTGRPLPPGTRVVPGAAALAWAWGQTDHPRLGRAVRGADVLHATNYLVPPSRLPTLVTIHDCSLVRHRHLCPPAVLAVEPALRRALRRGAHVHVPSRFVADEVREVFGRDLRPEAAVHVVAWGVPPLAPLPSSGDGPEPGAIPDGPFVLALGALEPRKNLAHLVAAFGAIAGERRDLTLVLAGPEGPARPEIDAAIGRLAAPIAARVLVTGPVSEAVRAALLRRAAVVAYPSVYEGFGFPVLEAMQCGIPVVAARAGAIPEVAGDAACLVEATDEAAMAGAIARLCTDASARDHHIARGRARASQFSWTACARALAGCYASVARGRRPARRS